jgi:hypothetical protein
MPAIRLIRFQMVLGNGVMLRKTRLYIRVIIAEFACYLLQFRLYSFIAQGRYPGDDMQNPFLEWNKGPYHQAAIVRLQDRFGKPDKGVKLGIAHKAPSSKSIFFSTSFISERAM